MNVRLPLILICVAAWSATAQVTPDAAESEVVATIGPHTILARDVLERIELMPWPGKDRPFMRDSVMLQATLSLVAEKLLSLRATFVGIGLDEESAARFAALERALARDELYRQEIAGKVTLSQEEASLALGRFAVQIRCAVFAVRDEQDARALVRELSAGKRGDGRMRIGVGRADTVTVSYGELARAHEDVAYSLTRRLEARVSFTPASGWLVLQLLDRRSNPASAALSVPDRAAAAEKLFRKRKQTELAAAYEDRYAAGIPTRMDSVLFTAVADTLLSLMRGNVDAHRKGKAFGVLEDDILRLRRAFRAGEKRPFITHGRDTISLGGMIGAMVFHPIQTRSLGTGIFREDLNRAMITVAEAELISTHEMQQHVNAHPDVRRDLGTWTEAWQTQELVRRILDSARTAGRKDDPLNAYIARLAAEYRVAIDIPKVRQIPFTPVNVVTRRLLGFGGTLPAVPLLPHLWEWFPLWTRSRQIPP